MNKRKFVAGVSIMTVAMAMGSPAMEAFAAETAVQFSGDHSGKQTKGKSYFLPI